MRCNAMRKIKNEEVLLYNFVEEQERQEVQQFFTALHINPIVVKQEDYCQKVGYLLGLTGFSVVEKNNEGDFDFSHKVMVFHNIKNKRLDDVLAKLHNASIATPYKAVVTPLNRFWSLKRLCLTMYKEHGAVIEQKKKQEKNV